MRFFMQAILCVVLAFSLSSCALVQRIEDNFSKERPKISFESPLKVFTKELSEDTLLAHETLSFVSIDEKDAKEVLFTQGLEKSFQAQGAKICVQKELCENTTFKVRVDDLGDNFYLIEVLSSKKRLSQVYQVAGTQLVARSYLTQEILDGK